MDEGYMLHMSERISKGQIPFRDFLSQYSPGYLYLIALFFKIFGFSILIGRFISMAFCIGILVCVFLILYELKIFKKLIHLLTFLSIISFGFPLLNFAIISWPIVFFSLVLTIGLIKYFQKPNLFTYLLIGFILSFILFFKQNFGVYYSFLVLLIVFFNNTNRKLKELFLIFSPLVIFTAVWTSISFFNNYEGFFEFTSFSVNFGTTFKFSYPPISMLSQPLGIFKLIPYYLPIVFLITICYFGIKNNINKNIFIFSIVSLVGFFGLIYPGSDLLHLYPFYGIVLVSLLLFLTSKRIYSLAYILIFINIIIGFYLTFFREYIRYSPPYRFQNTKVMINRSSNILTTKEQAEAIRYAYNFINNNTKKDEAIFVYPTSPMLYFLLDRPNPSKDSLYVKPYSTFSDMVVLGELKNKKVRFIVTSGEYVYSTPLSEYIQKQKFVFNQGPIKIFYIEEK